MKLYMFEHCSLCFRVRMTAALKGLPLEEETVLDDDTDTLVSLVGKRVIPILIKDDNSAMLESMDMVDHIDSMGTPVLAGDERPEIGDIADRLLKTTPPLTMPRYPLLPLPEFATVAARDHFIVRKQRVFNSFVELRARTREFLVDLLPVLDDLDQLIKSPQAINGELSRDDIRILPLLRSAAVVQGLVFPHKVRAYFEIMMKRTGFDPLPVI
jgi:glutaredoxin 2